MIIKTTSGKEIDTDKLSDVKAAAYEKLAEMHAFFFDLQVPYLLRIHLPDGKASGAQSLTHPSSTPSEVTLAFIAQCIQFINRHLPGYTVVLMPSDEVPPVDEESPTP
jgi:hypothetical protein